jgi:hypothetical protein
MAGVKGRSGRPKGYRNLVEEARKLQEQALPEIIAGLIQKARDGDKDCLIYMANRILGTPKQTVESKNLNLSLSGDDISKLQQLSQAVALMDGQLLQLAPPNDVETVDRVETGCSDIIEGASPQNTPDTSPNG